jgi:hypothetical protein
LASLARLDGCGWLGWKLEAQACDFCVSSLKLSRTLVMEQDRTLSYAAHGRAQRLPQWRGPSSGNGLVGVLGIFSWIYCGWMFYMLVGDHGLVGLGILIFGGLGVFAQGVLTSILSLVYFTRCRRFKRKGEIILMCIVFGAPIVTGILTALALAFRRAPFIAM